MTPRALLDEVKQLNETTRKWTDQGQLAKTLLLADIRGQRHSRRPHAGDRNERRGSHTLVELTALTYNTGR
jgi:hypothetical protein